MNLLPFSFFLSTFPFSHHRLGFCHPMDDNMLRMFSYFLAICSLPVRVGAMSITGAPPSSHMCHAHGQIILQKTHSVSNDFFALTWQKRWSAVIYSSTFEDSNNLYWIYLLLLPKWLTFHDPSRSSYLTSLLAIICTELALCLGYFFFYKNTTY